MLTRLIVVAGLTLSATSLTHAQSARVYSLGGLNERDIASYAHGMSSDGVHIVGGAITTSDTAPFVMRACRWNFPVGGTPSAANGLASPATSTDFGSLAVAISDDGERIVGSIGMVQEFFFGLLYSPWHAMYWWDVSSPSSTADWLPDLMEFSDIAANGQVVCGSTRFPFFEPIPGDPIRWTGPASAPELLGSLGGNGQAHAISADGSAIVGESANFSGGAVNTFLWTEETGIAQLPNTPGDVFHTGMGMNPDARFVVGGIVADASIWTESAGILNIGRHPGSSFAYAQDVSADGSIVVGYSVTDGDTRTSDAFVWTAKHGMRSLADVLANDHGVDVSGWHFDVATAISDDGRTIIGHAQTPAGRVEGFAVRFEDAGDCRADFNEDGVVNSQDLFDFLAVFFPAAPKADFNADGVVNSQDFFDFLGAFFAGC